MTERDVALKVTAAQIRTITVALMFFIITERTMRHGDGAESRLPQLHSSPRCGRPVIASATMAVSTATTAARPTTDASGVPATNRGPPPRVATQSPPWEEAIRRPATQVGMLVSSSSPERRLGDNSAEQPSPAAANATIPPTADPGESGSTLRYALVTRRVITR